MKKLKLLLLMLVLPCCMFFSGCTLIENTTITEPYMVSFEKAGETLDSIQYIIKFSDGTEKEVLIPKTIDASVSVSMEDLQNYLGDNFDTWLNQNVSVEYNGQYYVSLAELKQHVEADGGNFDDYIKDCIKITYNGNNFISFEDLVNYCEQNNKNVSDYVTLTITNKQYAVNKALNSTVIIASISGSSVGAGAGFVYLMDDTYSYIVTCEHVVDNAVKIYAYQYGSDDAFTRDENNNFATVTEGKAIKCDYVGGTAQYDVAVLRVKTQQLLNNNPNTQAAEIAKSYSLADTVYAIGNPGGWTTSVTEGIISVESEYWTTENDVIIREMRIDAAVNGGNSGGGLFNAEGQVVGLVNAKLVDTKIDNMAMAIPVDNFTKVADNILYYYHKNGTPTTQIAYWNLDFEMGYTSTKVEYDSQNQKYNLIDYTAVKSIETDSYGYSIGLRQGDVITACYIERTGQTPQTVVFDRAHQFEELMLTIRKGDKISITVKRGSTTPTLDPVVVETLAVI